MLPPDAGALAPVVELRCPPALRELTVELVLGASPARVFARPALPPAAAPLGVTVERVAGGSPFVGDAASVCEDVAAPAVEVCCDEAPLGVCCEEDPQAATVTARTIVAAAANASRSRRAWVRISVIALVGVMS